jgi:hypothetical protein
MKIIIITESHLRKIINEFDISIHSKERMDLRLDQTSYDVVAFPKTGLYKKIVIGKFNIPQDAKTTVDNIFKKLNDPDYRVPQYLALVIQLYEFKLKLENITFIGSPEEQKRYKQIFGDRQNWNIYLQTLPDDKGRMSHGRFLICVARGNVISTMFLLRDQTQSFEKLKEHMLRNFPTLKEVIFVGNPETQLDTYIDIDIDRARLNPPKEQQIPIEQLPQMSDKERRLQSYKEKMKRNFGK